MRVVWPGGAQRLATADDIDPGSLAVGEQRVFWTRGGVPESAPLP
ncbi:MAG TPA: hypothetical protein VM266_11245 [Solirubrobacteraceae bacterium]|nr:hypothetical protein [Solirubrobacteraceae bacterium]